ncbi:MAG: hypothetical protein ACYDGM_08240, partial [Vulcanimicrobiaceae bacterium]
MIHKLAGSSIALVAILFALSLPARAQLSLPISIPGVNTSNLAAKAVAKQFQPYFDAHQPVIRDWSYLYPTVPVLPGPAFRPATMRSAQLAAERTIIAQLRTSLTGDVVLRRGDYAIPVKVFCTNLHAHANAPYIYLLGPLRGTRAALLSRMYARAAGADSHFGDLQSLSWSLQDGLSYSQLDDNEQQLFNQLLPGQRGAIGDNFIDDLSNKWDSLSSNVPGAPSFGSALGQIGPLGDTIEQMRSAQDELTNQSVSFDVLRASLVLGPMGPTDSNIFSTPWSVPWAGTYIRLLTEGAFGSTGLLEIRVVPERNLVPITDNIGYPPRCMQCQ